MSHFYQSANLRAVRKLSCRALSSQVLCHWAALQVPERSRSLALPALFFLGISGTLLPHSSPGIRRGPWGAGAGSSSRCLPRAAPVVPLLLPGSGIVLIGVSTCPKMKRTTAAPAVLPNSASRADILTIIKTKQNKNHHRDYSTNYVSVILRAQSRACGYC